MKKMILVKNLLGMCLVLGTADYAFSEDAEVKLDSNNGSSKFIVQDKDAVTVFSVASDGNLVIGGTVTVAGSVFSVGGSTLAVGSGNVGIGTTGPATRLEVNGAAQFGSGVTKSTFTAAGALNLAANQDLTLSGTGKVTGLAAPAAGSDAANKQYVDGCSTGMAYIPGPLPFCVDKYEAWNSNGGTIDNTGCADGTQAQVNANATTAIAGSAAGQAPLIDINWCAAKKACQNAGKHLLTNMEWFTAANYRGSKWNITAEENVPAEVMVCNTNSGGANTTGLSPACVTQEGVYDMIGNVWEWVDFVMTADPANGVASNYITGYDFATGMPTSVGGPSPAFGDDFYWPYNGAGVARALLRGGSWGNGAAAGVFAFNAINVPSTWTSAFGFRCGRRK